MRRAFVLVVALLSALAWAVAPAAAAPAVTAAPPGPAAALIGGDHLVLGGGARCVIGFNAYHPRGARYVVTAGCGGAAAGGGAIAAPAGSTSTALVRNGGGTLTVSGTGSAVVGQTVCVFGPVGGYRCGTVTALNQTINYGGTTIYGLIRTNICVHAGESGSPLYRVVAGKAVAIGVLVGGSGSCGAGGTSFFKPVAPILASYGIGLYTG